MIEAVSTLISGGHGFFMGAVGQKMLLDEFCPEWPHVVMVENNSYPEYKIKYLKEMGCEIRIVPALRTKRVRFAAGRWPRTFTKLNLWDLTEFEHVLFMDADAYPYHEAAYTLFKEMEPDFLGATTFHNNKNRFRSGMMVVRPEESRFQDLRKYLKRNPVEIGAKLGDQGVLNCYVNQNNIDWTRICYHWHTVVWPRRPQNIIIGHIRPKPWQTDPRLPCGRKNGIHPYVDTWKKAILEAESKFGPIPQ
jgi:hypothetical protein